MASASKTPNLNLPQWVGTEKPERTDFNAAFDAIDDHVAESASKHITESGSNANGSYIKFDDGTMICRVWNFTLDSTGWLVRQGDSLSKIWTFPMQFVDANINVSGSITNTGTAQAWCTSFVGLNPSANNVEVILAHITHTFTQGNSALVSVMAIGRWK